MRKIFFVFVFFIAFEVWATPKPAYNWILLSDGIVYAKHSFALDAQNRTTIHAFQIDPAKVKIDVVTADANQPQGTTVSDLAKKKNAVLVVNGGFFTPEHKSIGLLIQSGKQINPIHKTSWWSIFGLKAGRPFIVTPKEFRPSPEIGMAVQAGPRLVIDGAIPKLKQDLSVRSAVGITKDRKVILALTEGGPISLKDLALRMKGSRFEGGLECTNAMALDGGGSAQIYAKIKKFELSVPGSSQITNGIAVYVRAPLKT